LSFSAIFGTLGWQILVYGRRHLMGMELFEFHWATLPILGAPGIFTLLTLGKSPSKSDSPEGAILMLEDESKVL
jgi:hypothetical protein